MCHNAQVYEITGYTMCVSLCPVGEFCALLAATVTVN